MLHVLPLPNLVDNYAWALFHHPAPRLPAHIGAECIVVDPGEAAPVAETLAQRGLILRGIWLTHHHHDHTGGVADLVRAHPPGHIQVVGAAVDQARLPPLTQAVDDQARWRAGVNGLGEVTALAVPGHTRGALAFHLAQGAALFTGDTLFLAGCGRLMEGTAAQMQASLARLAALPAHTQVFCGHEYTVKNLAFCRQIMPDDAALARRQREVEALRQAGRPSVPATLQEERATNLFLRAHQSEVQRAVGATDAAAAFAALRARRDKF